VSFFPTIGKPGVNVVSRPRRKIHQQLHEVELRIHFVAAAAAGQAGQDRCGPPRGFPTNSEFLRFQNHTLHLPSTHMLCPMLFIKAKYFAE